MDLDWYEQIIRLGEIERRVSELMPRVVVFFCFFFRIPAINRLAVNYCFQLGPSVQVLTACQFFFFFFFLLVIQNKVEKQLINQVS